MNILTGERYSTTIDELALYVQGAYGQPPAPINQEAKDRILSTPRGRELTGWTRPELTLDEVRDAYAGGTRIGDDDLFRLHFAPMEDVEATRAAGPMRRDYPIRSSIDEVVALALERRDVRRLSIRDGDIALDLRR